MEFNSKNRTKRIMVWVSNEEKILLEAKANYYCYKSFASYIRDAAIYEKVTHVDVASQDEIYNAYVQNTKELKKITKEIRRISKFATQVNDADIHNVTSLMLTIIKNQDNMLKLIDTKLDLDVWKEINHNKHLQEE